MEDNQIFLSICCLTYNHELYIRDCLEGFIKQKTNFLFEILIHDDASTDRTPEIIRDYERIYPELIKPIYQKENQYSKGKGISIKFQFPRAKGKYIAICEGDDYWTDPYKLQKQVDFLEKNDDYGLVYTEYDTLYQSTKRIEKNSLKCISTIYPNTFEDFLINSWFVAPVTWVFRSAILNQFYSKFKDEYVVGDLPLLLTISANYKVGYIEESMAVYRVLINSASHFKDYHKEYKFELGLFNIHLDFANHYKVEESTMTKMKDRFYPYIFQAACLLNDKEVKYLAYNHIKENKLLTKKMEFIFQITRFSFPRVIFKIYIKLKFRALNLYFK
jgi:glycosyltransferase involved in cell wall biosynthesis